jgi:hypothetical protein
MSYYKEVQVTSFYFARGSRCFPKRIELEGRQLHFLENGLRCLVQKGQELVQIFNMTDGQSLYRLSFEPGNRTWKLLSARALGEAS